MNTQCLEATTMRPPRSQTGLGLSRPAPSMPSNRDLKLFITASQIQRRLDDLFRRLEEIHTTLADGS